MTLTPVGGFGGPVFMRKISVHKTFTLVSVLFVSIIIRNALFLKWYGTHVDIDVDNLT